MCPSFRHASPTHRASFPPGMQPSPVVTPPPCRTPGGGSTALLLPGSRLGRQNGLFLRMGWSPRFFTSQGTVGGAAGARTPNLRRARAALSHLSYDPSKVGAPGLEPGTSALSGPRSNQLSYAPRRLRRPAHRCLHPRHWTVRSCRRWKSRSLTECCLVSHRQRMRCSVWTLRHSHSQNTPLQSSVPAARSTDREVWSSPEPVPRLAASACSA